MRNWKFWTGLLVGVALILAGLAYFAAPQLPKQPSKVSAQPGLITGKEGDGDLTSPLVSPKNQGSQIAPPTDGADTLSILPPAITTDEKPESSRPQPVQGQPAQNQPLQDQGGQGVSAPIQAVTTPQNKAAAELGVPKAADIQPQVKTPQSPPSIKQTPAPPEPAARPNEQSGRPQPKQGTQVIIALPSRK